MDEMNIKMFFQATIVVSGAGSIAAIGEQAAGLGAKRVLIITDAFLASGEVMEKIKKSLEEAGITYVIYDKCRPNPRTTDCEESAEIAKTENIDAVIGFGGGSAMDQAKATAALVTNGGTCVDWEDKPLDEYMLPVITVPTTAGTGSECTFCAVITDEARGYKMAFFDPIKLRPSIAIADPEITLTLPPLLTASTGMDALTHAIEAYTCVVSQTITDALALHAIKLISANIEEVVKNGSNLDARTNLMMGSLMAGIAFNNSCVGSVHAISETIGGMFDVPHGIANSIFLPYVIKYNVPACPEKFAEIAKYMGLTFSAKSDEEIGYALAEYIHDLNNRIGIPKYAELDFAQSADYEEIAQRCEDNLNSMANARPMKKQDYKAVFKAALRDEL